LLDSKIKDDTEVPMVVLEQTRRDFLSKYGKLAVITPVAMTALMSPSTSAAPKSCRGNNSRRCR